MVNEHACVLGNITLSRLRTCCVGRLGREDNVRTSAQDLLKGTLRERPTAYRCRHREVRAGARRGMIAAVGLSLVFGTVNQSVRLVFRIRWRMLLNPHPKC